MAGDPQGQIGVKQAVEPGRLARGWRRERPGTRRRFHAAIAFLVLGLLLLSGGCDRLPGRGGPDGKRPSGLTAQAPGGNLQEVAPPGAVAQLNAALGDRHPRVAISAPSDGTVLPPGPWPLEVAVADWPLVDAGPLGLGPHLVVQVDDGPARRISDWQNGDPDSGRLRLTLPELSPGSHRLLVYAARPWGEAVKQPGAVAQLQVHRVSANPLSQPPPASPLLWPTSPAGLAAAEPVLVDWLLQDAPLQGLREGDARWRLRITVNGDSFLADQNTPIWLRGLRRGSNAVLLELLDGQGEPLNPPFNSAVREVRLDGAGPRPAWLAARLGADDLARLLGEAPLANDNAESGSATSVDSTAGSDASADSIVPIPIQTEINATEPEPDSDSEGDSDSATAGGKGEASREEMNAEGSDIAASGDAGSGEAEGDEAEKVEGDGAPGPEAGVDAPVLELPPAETPPATPADTPASGDTAPATANGEVQP